jgi:hypothetical protein
MGASFNPGTISAGRMNKIALTTMKSRGIGGEFDAGVPGGRGRRVGVEVERERSARNVARLKSVESKFDRSTCLPRLHTDMTS